MSLHPLLTDGAGYGVLHHLLSLVAQAHSNPLRVAESADLLLAEALLELVHLSLLVRESQNLPDLLDCNRFVHDRREAELFLVIGELALLGRAEHELGVPVLFKLIYLVLHLVHDRLDQPDSIENWHVQVYEDH